MSESRKVEVYSVCLTWNFSRCLGNTLHPVENHIKSDETQPCRENLLIVPCSLSSQICSHRFPNVFRVIFNVVARPMMTSTMMGGDIVMLTTMMMLLLILVILAVKAGCESQQYLCSYRRNSMHSCRRL